MNETALIDALCEAYGLGLSFDDASGARQHASEDGKRAVLAALGVDISSSALKDSFAHARQRQERPVPRTVVCAAGEPVSITMSEASGEMAWMLSLESGESHQGRGDRGAPTLSLPALPPGYHTLRLRSGRDEFLSTVLAAPAQCYLPDSLEAGEKRWGVTAQVYSLRGTPDLGIGTYGDVATLAGAAGVRGAAFLGLSPLHALFFADASKYSPYSPSSRMWLQTGLIDVTATPGGAELAHAASRDMPDPGALIDYARVLPLKHKLLDDAWRKSGASDDGELDAFRRAGGESLLRHATFEALSEHFWAHGRHWVGAWPEAYRDAGSPEVAAFRREHEERIAFHIWLQWLADRQLAQASERARASGMEIGLYRDLAVGADRGGSEFWSDPARFVAGLSVGAPPDLLGPQGQDWGLPPLDPIALETSGLTAFRELVAANMRHAGALRIDHAFQLQRLYVLPLGGTARDGIYLSYPFEAMLAVLRIESHRARCAIIAEDLGTAPTGFSDAIMASGLLSYRIVPFERGADGTFIEPGAYPRLALSAFATHDLPTVAGWWRGVDIDLRECFGAMNAESARAGRAERAGDRERFRQALEAEQIPLGTTRPDTPPISAAMRFVARTRAALTAVQLEDVFGDAQQANLPGPDQGHPNWRRRAGVSVEEIAAGHNAFDRAAAVFHAEGRASAAARSGLTRPRATYRLQLHANFTFDDAAAITPYLRRLGVSHVYTSSIQTARPGSTHGYDVVDPTRINPELGGEEGFRRFSDALRENGLKLLVDIVPNHMGVGGSANPWWLDLLEWGRLSPHADTFDVDWEKPGAEGKLVVPFLGSPLEGLLEKNEVALRFDPEQGRFAVWYADHCHPVSPLDYGAILARVRVKEHADEEGVRRLAEAFSALRGGDFHSGRMMQGKNLQQRLAKLCKSEKGLAEGIESAAKEIKGAELKRLIERQSWKLLFWKEANEAINYRRFFDITSLAGIRMEDPRVFAAWHKRIFELIADNRIHGLRIDHVDGLAAPSAYLRQLDEAVGPDFYTVVEKILEPGEDLPAWPVAGTTGYDALHMLDGVFFNAAALPELDAIYADVKGHERNRDESLPQIRVALAEKTFASERNALVADVCAALGAGASDHDRVNKVVLALLAAFPVYRIYGEQGPLSAQDRASLEAAYRAAASALRPEERDVLERIVALLAREGDGASAETRAVARRAQRRFQQLTGPLMAKSFEDTLFYRHARFIAANEVGCGPDDPGVDAQTFHRANEKRADRWPGSLLATSTHDTKRGEDARGRLLAASHDMEGWRRAWSTFRDANRGETIEAADLYFIFQSLIAAAPVEPSEKERSDFDSRAKEFVVKSLREGKLRSSWTAPDEAYERAAQDCIARAAAPQSVLFGELAGYIRSTALAGAKLGIARTVLKCTMPGVPDTYQGSELADLSFVDPDNRRPVDYSSRTALLEKDFDPADESRLLSGEGKLAVLARLLRDRDEHPHSYAGDYQPLELTSEAEAIGFLRGGDLAIIVRRAFGSNPHDDWGGSLPPGSWRNLLDGTTVSGGHKRAGAHLLGAWPAAVTRRI